VPAPLYLNAVGVKAPMTAWDDGGMDVPEAGYLFVDQQFSDVGVPYISPPIFAGGLNAFGVNVDNQSVFGQLVAFAIQMLHPLTFVNISNPLVLMNLPVGPINYFTFGLGTGVQTLGLGTMCFSVVMTNGSGTDPAGAGFELWALSSMARGTGFE
jgi:hypothetical protein